MTTAEQIKNLRTQHNLSQSQFARKIHASKTSVYQWEAGNTTPRRDKLEQIAAAFEIPLETLTGQTQKRSRKDRPQSHNEVHAVAVLRMANPNLFSAEMNNAIQAAIERLAPQ